jgi:hypothetical protein
VENQKMLVDFQLASRRKLSKEEKRLEAKE